MKEEKSKIIKEINNIIDNKNENSKYDKSINKYVDEINGIPDKNKLSLSERNKYLKLIKEGTNEPKTINNININISFRNEQKNENNFKNRIKFFESKKENNIQNKKNFYEPQKLNNVAEKKLNEFDTKNKLMKKLNFEEVDFSEEDEKGIKDQLLKYSKEINRKYQNYIISYINQATYSVCNFSFYETQIISLLFLINKKDGKGRFAQILTGEGKTKIIIALAAYHVILGHCVDIVTSQKDLAIRDSADPKNAGI